MQQILAVAIAHLRHIRRLRKVTDLAVDARLAGGRALAGGHEAVRDGEADQDCETRADDNEEGHQYAVEGWWLVGGLTGHCGVDWLALRVTRGDVRRRPLTFWLFEWILWWRGGFRGGILVAGVAKGPEARWC